MRNKFLLILLTTALVVSLVGVAACAEEEEAPPEEWQWPDKLHLVTMSTASAAYAQDMAYGVVLEDDTGMKVRVTGEDSFILIYQWMKQGRFFWATLEILHIMHMLEGKYDWASRDGGPWQMRTVWPASSLMCLGYAVRGDSGIETPYDVKPGMKIGYLTIAPAGRVIMEALLAWAQVDPEDVVWVPESTMEMSTVHIMDGRADVVWGGPSAAWWYEAEAAPHGLAWIELNAEEDPEGFKRYQEIVPSAMIGVNPMGVPSGIGVHTYCDIAGKVTRVDTDPELVYQVVKWMDENFDRYKDAHPRCEGMTIDNLMFMAETGFLPLHEGTIRYLEELGLWTDAHEARNQANIDLLTRWCEAYQTAIDMADEQGIWVDPKNEEWMELWDNYKTELGLPGFKMFPGLD